MDHPVFSVTHVTENGAIQGARLLNGELIKSKDAFDQRLLNYCRRARGNHRATMYCRTPVWSDQISTKPMRREQTMKNLKTLTFSFGLAVTLPLAAQMQPAPAPVGQGQLIEVTAKVEDVDLAKRLITVKGPQGRVVVSKVDPAEENLDKVKVGDERSRSNTTGRHSERPRSSTQVPSAGERSPKAPL
jgi:hypothetical protein